MSGQSGNDAEVSCWCKTIGKKLDDGRENLFSSARIFKVPKDLRKLNESSYTPHLIAIGPFHRKDKQLQTSMEQIKLRYARDLLCQVADKKGGENCLNGVLKECVKKMGDRVCKAKKYYAEVDNAKEYDEEEVTLVHKGKKHNAEEVTVVHKARKCDASAKSGANDDDGKDGADNDADAEMVEMMLVDGCFILRLLYFSYVTKEKEKRNPSGADNGYSMAIYEGEPMIDPIYDNTLIAALVKQDLTLLENQIPFFVLQDLFKITVAQIQIPKENNLLLEDYVFYYWDNIKRPEDENSGSKSCCALSVGACVLSVARSSTKESCELAQKSPTQYYHILHFLHDYLLPGDHVEKEQKKGLTLFCDIPLHLGKKKKKEQKKLCGLQVCASDLHYAGVNFAPAKKNNLFSVRFEEPQGIRWWFHRAKFEIPTFDIDDSTETFLRNLIALEQCCPGVRRYFTSYAKFMDMLIDSEKDVQVLKKAEVIRNNMGADIDVSCLFNNLCKEVVGGEFYFNDTYYDAYMYSKGKWPKVMAFLKRTYSDSPWQCNATIATLIAFAIALVQFIRSFQK